MGLVLGVVGGLVWGGLGGFGVFVVGVWLVWGGGVKTADGTLGWLIVDFGGDNHPSIDGLHPLAG